MHCGRSTPKSLGISISFVRRENIQKLMCLNEQIKMDYYNIHENGGDKIKVNPKYLYFYSILKPEH